MDDELEEDEERISFVLGVFGTLIFAVVDLISLIPFAGDIESIVSTIGIVLGFVSGGLGGAVMAVWSVVTIAKYIPIIQEIPLWTPGWLFVWYAMNHPSGASGKALKIAQTAASIEEGAEATEAAAGAAEKGVEEATEEGVEEATKATGEAAKATEAAAGATETAEAAKTAENTEAAESAKEMPNGEGDTNDEMTPENARNPMDVLGDNINMPNTDFDQDEDGDEDEELPMAA